LRFTVRRPPTGEVSPCSHRPSGGDVACSVDVGVAPPGTAGFTLEDRLALAVSGCDVPACGATLRRIRSRDLLNPAQSFVLQTSDKLAPTTSADRAVEPSLLGHSHPRLFEGAARGARHRPHVKLLDPDQVEPPCEVGGGFLDPVFTPIRFTGFELGDSVFRLLAAMGTTLGAGQSPLQNPQPLRLTQSQAWGRQQLAGRQRSRHGNAAVDTDHAAVRRAGDRVGNVRECDMPAASPVTGNPIGLDTRRHRSRQAESHPPDLGHPYPTKATVQSLDVMRFHRDLPKPFVHTSFTPRRAAMRAVEEAPHGLREIPQRLLLHRMTPSTKPRVLGASFGQLRRLLQISGGLAARSPVLLLLHRQIPHIPRVPAVRQQRLLLIRGRQQSEPRHIRTVATTTDIPGPCASAPLGIGFLPEHKSRTTSRRRLR
jgi:hypothetical protein